MINHLIKQRFSPRALNNMELEPEKIRSLFEAARWAPSSMNEQPWRFIIASKNDEETFTKMVGVLNNSNKIWASNAPLLVLTIASLNYSLNERPNRFSIYDVGQAVAYLTLQATSMNLFIHQMGGFNSEKARELFNVPNSFAPVSILAVGYKGDIESLPVNLRIKEAETRKRKPLEHFVFPQNLGNPGN